MAEVLKLRSKGAPVRRLQEQLNKAGIVVKVDGEFGIVTEAAVKTFQTRFGLVVDGKAGPQTLTALAQATTPAKPAKPEPDKSAMLAPAPASDPVPAKSAAPPNADSLQLLSTARPIKEIIVHCTATAEGKDYTVADIRSWHKARGWSDIGYHYVVYRDGRVMIGRPVGQIGAHTEGRNTGTIGISYVGGVASDGKTAKDTRTAAQRSSLTWLVKALVKKHNGVKKVSGHNQYASKACPSFKVQNDPLSAIAG